MRVSPEISKSSKWINKPLPLVEMSGYVPPFKRTAVTVAAEPICAAPSRPAQVKPTGYVPPAKREAQPKSFDEDFPTLASGSAAGHRTEMKFGDLVKARAEQDAIDEVLNAKKAATASAETNAALYAPQGMSINTATVNRREPFNIGRMVNSYVREVNIKREAAERRRRRLFDFSDDEEPIVEQQSLDDEEYLSEEDFEDSDDEEVTEAYDASAFDRHR
jgi:hypothetical protein